MSRVAEELLETGTVRHSFFGIQPGSLTPRVARLLDVEAESGVVVLDVAATRPAAEAGVEPGDVILGIGGRGIRSVEEFLAELRRHEPEYRLEVELLREGERRTLSVVLTHRPPD